MIGINCYILFFLYNAYLHGISDFFLTYVHMCMLLLNTTSKI